MLKDVKTIYNFKTFKNLLNEFEKKEGKSSIEEKQFDEIIEKYKVVE